MIITLAIWAGISLALFVSTFLFYVAIMSIREKRSHILELHWSVRWVYYLLLFIGLVLDTLLNWIFLTVVFLEFPKEFLATPRVVRHKHHSTGWRQLVANWFCHNWLTPFDKSHCK